MRSYDSALKIGSKGVDAATTRNSRRTGPPARPTRIASSLVELRLLGPLEVRRLDEPLALGGRQQRALLAVLALELGGVVSVERLVDALWGDQPPATAAHAVEVYASKLRKVLGANAIVRSAGGYLLDVPPEHIDAVRFERLFAEGQGALPEDPARAAVRFRQALALWRGAPLADFTYDPFAQAEIVRLEVLRDNVEEACVEAELSLGRGGAVIGMLEQMVTRAPLRERPCALLMRALYQAGRQADALAAYQGTRRLLVDELGLEPGPELKAAQQAILTQDPRLTPPLKTVESPEVRRWVTVLACDLTDSTTPTFRLDPEVLEPILDRYAEAISTTIARYGGTVERSSGGSVVAVFGAPVAHEDDALRALRAAGEIVSAASELAEELERDVPVPLAVRLAVDSGEVISRRTADRRVTGNVVLATAALHAAAQPGEVVVGEATLRLVAHATCVEPIAGLEPTAGGAGVEAWRLLDLIPDAPALPRFLDADLVGRHEELAQLGRLYARAVEDRAPILVSVLGEPGIGKTRLARELAASLEGHARVLVARVHPYGEATFAPIREIVEQAVGDHSRESILAVLSGDTEAARVADRIAALLGVSSDLVQREEIFWAVRRLLEALARERPLVLIVDDLHWAASTFLDLLEYVAATASGPIQLVCLARTDLLEERPRWGDDGSRLALSSLSPPESEALVGVLAGTIALSERERGRIVDAAAGNPLFLEQLVAFAAETGDNRSIPPSLESLLASRLDRLGPGERAILEAAAIVGTEFSLPAVGALLPAELGANVSRHVEALVRKEFLAFDLRPALFKGAARFRHVLLRTAAYRSVPKTRRADLHERLADWLADDELVAHHLEWTYRYREELGRLDDRTAALGAEAARRFAAAGRRAHAQHDHASAADLFGHAVGLLAADDPLRRSLLPELGEDLFWLGRHAEARSVLAEARGDARRAGDRGAEWHAVLVALTLQAEFAGDGMTSAELERTATEALEFFESVGDARGVARAAFLVGDALSLQARYQDATRAYESAIANARVAGDDALEGASIGSLTATAMRGPTPIEEAISLAEGYLARAPTRMLEQVLLRQLAHSYAQQARFDTAREYIARSRVLANEFGTEVDRANLAWHFAAAVERFAGNLAGAEAELRQGHETLRRLGEYVWRAEAAVSLAGVLVSLGRVHEAETLLGIGDETATSQDLDLQVVSRLVRAQILVARSKLNEAERLVREALSLLDDTDDVVARADALIHLARILTRGGRPDEARSAATEALWLSEKKGNLVLANEARTVLEATVKDIAPTG